MRNSVYNQGVYGQNVYGFDSTGLAEEEICVTLVDSVKLTLSTPSVVPCLTLTTQHAVNLTIPTLQRVTLTLQTLKTRELTL